MYFKQIVSGNIIAVSKVLRRQKSCRCNFNAPSEQRNSICSTERALPNCLPIIFDDRDVSPFAWVDDGTDSGAEVDCCSKL